jgi:hypothetical protein
MADPENCCGRAKWARYDIHRPPGLPQGIPTAEPDNARAGPVEGCPRAGMWWGSARMLLTCSMWIRSLGLQDRPRRAGRPPGWPGTDSLRLGRGGLDVASRTLGRRDATQPQRARSVIPFPVENGRETPDPESDVWRPGRPPLGASPPPSLPAYISWYINGYGRPWTSSDVNPRISSVHGPIAGHGGALPATTEQKEFCRHALFGSD